MIPKKNMVGTKHSCVEVWRPNKSEPFKERWTEESKLKLYEHINSLSREEVRIKNKLNKCTRY